jgi:hypothetical protein
MCAKSAVEPLQSALETTLENEPMSADAGLLAAAGMIAIPAVTIAPTVVGKKTEEDEPICEPLSLSLSLRDMFEGGCCIPSPRSSDPISKNLLHGMRKP